MPGLIAVSPVGLWVENAFFTLAVVLYLAAAISYLINVQGKSEWGGFASLVLKIAFLTHSLFMMARAYNVQRLPFVGHYEFGNLFIWATALVYIWTEWRLKEKYYAVGAFITPLLMLYFAYLTVIPSIIPAVVVSRAHRPLLPILQSDWLSIHVASSVFGYAGFTLAFAGAMIWLLKKSISAESPLSRVLPVGEALDEYIYRASGFGFLFQTVMIISGAIWADISWGRYWGWDPKEMWSLITWFVFAVYLHARFTREWTGWRAIALVALGWVAMLFTWIGVAWLLPGLHAFG
ncbi:MAG: cytochrome c biogenesis protein CcsA [Dethiobacter sp.]|nr:cytochrome c biogenesis protein CcsA [Dethiobacter sp.]MCL5982865.1 cytochrome c biogenesis protein CcsA [Bacillota bacterium]